MAIAPRIGRWTVGPDGEVSLVGLHCRACGETLFPERPACSRCGSRDLDTVAVRGPGSLISYTVVHQAPAGFEAPYAVGYVALPGDVAVLAPIDAPPAALHHGMALALGEGVTGVDDDGGPFRTYRFRPIEA